MTDPISVDTALLSSQSFQRFRQAIAQAIRQYDTGSAAYFPFGEDLTDNDLALITPIVRAHPEGLFMLQALLGASGGDAEKVDLMSRILESAEEENTDIANFGSGPGTRT